MHYRSLSRKLLATAIWIALLVGVHAVHDIVNYGACPYSDTYPCQLKNAKALKLAIEAANSSLIDRTVQVDHQTYYTLPVHAVGLTQLQIIIKGRLAASRSVKNWPNKSDNRSKWDFIWLEDCSQIHIHGGGYIDGRGYHWWWLIFLDYFGMNKILPSENARPHLIHMQRCSHVRMHDLVLKNSPNYHAKLDECYDFQIYNLNIKVNTTAQYQLTRKGMTISGLIPMFPFNTDGIDPAGARMHMYNITCQNWDDVIVPKPQYSPKPCTGDMLIQNLTVRLGVGLSIGTVPPHFGTNCIRNVTFRNVVQMRPIKGIYLKTNPGHNGDGLIEDISFFNVSMDRPLWFGIYLGPQQQKQPDGGGPGCMLYPYDPHNTCSTQPLVTIRNILLQNISMSHDLIEPIVLRCNSDNPCKGIHFDRVVASVGPKQSGYVCQNILITQTDSQPVMNCTITPQQESQKNLKTNIKSEIQSNKQYKFDESYETKYLTMTRSMLAKMADAIQEHPYADLYDDEFDYNYQHEQE